MFFNKKDNKKTDIDDVNITSNFFEGNIPIQILLRQLFTILISLATVIYLLYVAISTVRPFVLTNEIEILGRFKVVPNTEYSLVYYKIEDDILKDYNDLVKNNIKKNKRRLFKKPLYIELIKRDNKWDLNKVSDKKIKKKKNEEKKYYYLEAVTNNDGQALIKGFQRYGYTDFFVSQIGRIHETNNDYYYIKLNKKINNYKIRKIRSNKDDIINLNPSTNKDNLEKELESLLN